MGGALVTLRDDELWQRIRTQQRLCGAIPSPFASWLTLRGITSLVPRVRWQNDAALAIARFLAEHPAVLEVLCADLPSHPQHAIAAKQSTGSGGLFSFRPRGGRDEALRVASQLRLFAARRASADRRVWSNTAPRSRGRRHRRRTICSALPSVLKTPPTSSRISEELWIRRTAGAKHDTCAALPTYSAGKRLFLSKQNKESPATRAFAEAYGTVFIFSAGCVTVSSYFRLDTRLEEEIERVIGADRFYRACSLFRTARHVRGGLSRSSHVPASDA